jgi:predicted amidohydrolase
MRVAAIQYRPPKGEPVRAREALCGMVQQACQQGASVVVCPEMATTGYVWPSPQAIMPHAEPAQGPTAAALGEAASHGQAWIFCGFAEVCQGRLYNSMLIIGPGGHLVDTAHGQVVPGICMDLNDPLFIAHLHHVDADGLAFCTNWVDQGEDPLPYWRWRLLGWRGWCVAANTWGHDAGTTFTGRSTILGPGGAVLARADREGDQVLMADL